MMKALSDCLVHELASDWGMLDWVSMEDIQVEGGKVDYNLKLATTGKQKNQGAPKHVRKDPVFWF